VPFKSLHFVQKFLLTTLPQFRFSIWWTNSLWNFILRTYFSVNILWYYRCHYRIRNRYWQGACCGLLYRL